MHLKTEVQLINTVFVLQSQMPKVPHCTLFLLFRGSYRPTGVSRAVFFTTSVDGKRLSVLVIMTACLHVIYYNNCTVLTLGIIKKNLNEMKLIKLNKIKYNSQTFHSRNYKLNSSYFLFYITHISGRITWYTVWTHGAPTLIPQIPYSA